MEAKRKQRLSRNKKKKLSRQYAKKGLTDTVTMLKEENTTIGNTIAAEKSMKEKYFEMRRASETEKNKLKTSKMVFSGRCLPASREKKEILQLDPSFLEEIDNQKVLGKGRFGVVVLQKFRSSPVAVKYFEPSTTPSMVTKEAYHLQQCCHINVPLLFGMNNSHSPYFIVTQFYASEDSAESRTIQDILSGKAEPGLLDLDEWLYVIFQLVDVLCHLHQKQILHNDIKSDNILMIKNAGFYSPILIDFGKACLISEAKPKKLTTEQQNRYQKEHSHISPEVVAGTQPQNIKSDVYSFGVVAGKIYRHCKHKPVKEIAKRWLCDFQTRCTSAQLMQIVESFRKLKA